MRTIHKFVYEIEKGKRQSFELPFFSTLVHIRETAKVPGEYDPSGLMNVSLWFEVDPDDERREHRTFEMFNTGADIPREVDGQAALYVGTFLPGSRLVFHLYEWVSFSQE